MAGMPAVGRMSSVAGVRGMSAVGRLRDHRRGHARSQRRNGDDGKAHDTHFQPKLHAAPKSIVTAIKTVTRCKSSRSKSGLNWRKALLMLAFPTASH